MEPDLGGRAIDLVHGRPQPRQRVLPGTLVVLIEIGVKQSGAIVHGSADYFLAEMISCNPIQVSGSCSTSVEKYRSI